MLVDWDPDCHSIALKLAVHLIHVKSIIQMLLEPEYVLLALPVLPLRHLGLEPTLLAQNLESSLASKEFGDEEIRLLILSLKGKGI